MKNLNKLFTVTIIILVTLLAISFYYTKYKEDKYHTILVEQYQDDGLTIKVDKKYNFHDTIYIVTAYDSTLTATKEFAKPDSNYYLYKDLEQIKMLKIKQKKDSLFNSLRK